jgi:hypothetical protein
LNSYLSCALKTFPAGAGETLPCPGHYLVLSGLLFAIGASGVFAAQA